jgi:hypothetical protein
MPPTPPVSPLLCDCLQETNFEGRVNLSPGIKIGHLKQEPELNDGAMLLFSAFMGANGSMH